MFWVMTWFIFFVVRDEMFWNIEINDGVYS